MPDIITCFLDIEIIPNKIEMVIAVDQIKNVIKKYIIPSFEGFTIPNIKKIIRSTQEAKSVLIYAFRWYNKYSPKDFNFSTFLIIIKKLMIIIPAS